jgi:hypothetical protein
VKVVSHLHVALKAKGSEEHVARTALMHASLRQKGLGVSGCAANEEGGVLTVNPPDGGHGEPRQQERQIRKFLLTHCGSSP